MTFFLRASQRFTQSQNCNHRQVRHLSTNRISLACSSRNRNYTGDILNFGLAKEQYAAAHPDKADRVKFVIVGDDVAVGRTQGKIVGRRYGDHDVSTFRDSLTVLQRPCGNLSCVQDRRCSSEAGRWPRRGLQYSPVGGLAYRNNRCWIGALSCTSYNSLI